MTTKSVCYLCSKKVGLLGFGCSSCQEKFCALHRMPEDHQCTQLEAMKNKYKEMAKEKLEKEAYKETKVIQI